jgi:hypothetical protein
MSRTPLNSRILPSDRDPERKTPLGNRVLPGKDKTPLGNRVLPGKDKTPTGGHRILPDAIVDLDQQLLAILRGLNMAVAVVAEARERRYAKPQAKLSSQMAIEAMLHLKEVAQLLDQVRRQLDR